MDFVLMRKSEMNESRLKYEFEVDGLKCYSLATESKHITQSDLIPTFLGFV